MIVLLGRLCDIHEPQRLVKSYILPCTNWYNFSLVLQAFLCWLCRLDFVSTFCKYFRSGQSHLKSRNNMLESLSNFVIFDLLKKHVNCKHIIAQNKKFCLYRSIDHYGPDPGHQATFYGGHKITVLIWPDCLRKVYLH